MPLVRYRPPQITVIPLFIKRVTENQFARLLISYQAPPALNSGYKCDKYQAKMESTLTSWAEVHQHNLQREKEALAIKNKEEVLQGLNWQETAQYIFAHYTKYKDFKTADFESQYLAEKVSDDILVLRHQHQKEPTHQDVEKLVSKVSCELQSIKVYTEQVATKHPHTISTSVWEGAIHRAERIAGIVGREAEKHLVQGDKPSIEQTGKWIGQAEKEIERHTAEIEPYKHLHKIKTEYQHRFTERFGVEPDRDMVYILNKKAGMHLELASGFRSARMSPKRADVAAHHEAEHIYRGSHTDRPETPLPNATLAIREKCDEYQAKMECTLTSWAEAHQHNLPREKEQKQPQMQQESSMEPQRIHDRSMYRGFER